MLIAERRAGLWIVLLLGLATPAARAGFTGGVGVVGDSFSDEYQFGSADDPDLPAARNYVEILAATRGLDFGPVSTADLGEPRRQGFAYDWARFGAATTELQGQLDGLAAQIQGGAVRLGSLEIGSNDFGRALLFPDPLTPLGAVLARAEANLSAAATRLLAADPNFDLVVFTVPDLQATPGLRALIASGRVSQAAADANSAAIQMFNDYLKNTVAAGNPRIAVADLHQAIANIEAAPTFTIGGVTIDTVTPSDSYDHLFLADGAHPGTVGQGLMANLFVAAADTAFGAGIAPLSDSEIVGFARAVPEPSGPALWGPGGLALLALAARRRAAR